MSLFERAKKARNKKGFTLVELIVVLVILAILAAIMVPALIGYIDKAKEKQLVVNARSAYVAAQTLVSEEYSKKSANIANVQPSALQSAIQTLAEVSGTLDYTCAAPDWKVKPISYEETGVGTVKYDATAGEWKKS